MKNSLTTMVESHFRNWCARMWVRYQQEKFDWEGIVSSEPRDYFSKYRWWLKNLYKQERNKNGIKNVRRTEK